MIRKLLMLTSLAGWTWAQPVPEPSPTIPPEAGPEPPKLRFAGFISTSYSLNWDQPVGGKNVLRGYDQDDRKLKLDALELDFQYGMSGEDQIGFRLDTVLGGSFPRIDAAAGLFRDPFSGSTNTDFDIRQAFVRYSLDDRFQIDAGKFATHLGYEIMPGVDGKNPHGTSAYSYTYNPFTHTGLRLNYALDEHWSLTGLAVLGADNFRDTNRSLSFGGQLAYKPNQDLSLAFSVLDGPERASNDSDRRRLYEVVTNYRVSEEVNLGLHAWTASEERRRSALSSAHYHGLVLYLQTQLTEQLFLSFRQEFFNDPEGVRLGVPARIRGLTITPEYRFTPDWAVRVDFRFDKADRPVFEAHGRPTDFQRTVFFNQTLRF